jgi:hypothetical protein
MVATFISITGDKEKRQETFNGRGQKFAMAIPTICMCNPLRKIHENHSHFHHME